MKSFSPGLERSDYPTVDSPLSHDFMDGLHRIKIRTINLEQNWQGIHKDLLALMA
jgi:hypothetical protein